MEGRHVSLINFRAAFVLLLVLTVTVLFLAVVWPFLKPLLLGALLAGLFHPFYRWMVRQMRGRESLAAALTLILLFFLVAGPISAFIGVVVQQAIGISNDAIPWVKEHLGSATAFNAHDWLVQRFPSLAAYVPQQEQMMDGAAKVAKATGAFLVAGATQITAGTATFLLNLFVLLYAMFFFMRDGRDILEKIFYYIPLDHEDEVRLLERLTSVTRATIKGTLVIGIIQGALAGLGFWAAGLDGAAFWGTVMAVLSVVPGIGAALVWVPAVIYLFIVGKTLSALLLLAWCAAIVGTVDNILRPRLVGKDAKMPDLLILVGTLGGLFLFGPIGFIIGPLVCGLFLTVWDIYGTTFKEILPPVRSLSSGKLKKPAANLERRA
ncbi:MAG: AI-2E family transporter [Verrucomicrobiota bacterium]|nr:AI-2E family transporter [Chthoniobacterales bacterium]MDQ3547095.1 AI-2E family transporter [Verrucomicrobiota bacterium]